jgi:hypothetical protein
MNDRGTESKPRSRYGELPIGRRDLLVGERRFSSTVHLRCRKTASSAAVGWTFACTVIL